MPRGRALISIHDVTPAFETEIRQALELLREWGLPAPALLTVPDFHGRWPLDAHPAFCSLLRSSLEQGCEIILHGYDHLAPRGVRPPRRGLERAKAALLTAGEGEFQMLPFARAVEKLARGRAMIERTVGVRCEGFVAPAWLENADTYRALDVEGFGFHEDHLWVKDLGTLGRRFAPAVSFTARSLARTRASVAWARAWRGWCAGWRWDLRLALHPADFGSGQLVKEIGRLGEAMSRDFDWTTYREYLELDSTGGVR